ncbi:hypothetical protein QN277_025029 [Acacia crassicarpa]|uniref:Late embryogenesis abundant protein LEA-2 subgroup domain-containing protein n=2 Tax=Acacia crassicarpa TaxID=499986 RepID=A0AAE1MPP5_9FABA|nr:hypothetical protein QN277_025029 [Acacia crassicarpa]
MKKQQYQNSNTMTESTTTHHNENQTIISQSRIIKRRRCRLVLGILLLLLILFFIVVLVLALTVFKPKDPTVTLVSASLNGVSPGVSFPAVQVHLNLTLDINLKLHNPNHASFKHEQGKSLLFYKGTQIGETEIFPGEIPAMGSTVLHSLLTLQLDKAASDLTGLIGDLMGGQLSMESSTRMPGRITILGFIKRHAVAVSECQFTIDVSDGKIRSQSCKNKTKF